MKQIIKRSFVIIITFVLVFSISIPCLASDNTHGGGGGWRNGMTYEDKVDWFRFNANSFFNQLLGLDEKAADRFASDIVRPYLDVKGYSSMEEYFADHINCDEDTQTFIPDNTFVTDMNVCLQQYNDTVKMTYRYFFNPDNVDFSIIENKDVRDELVRVMKEYPSFHFVITGRVANEVGQGPAFWILLNDDLEYAVCANNDLGIITKDTLYTSNWNNPVPHVKICIFDKARDDGLYWGYQIPSKPDQTQYYASFDDIYKMYKNGELASSTYSADYLYQLPLAPSRTTKLKLTSWRCPISAECSAINCYKSVADMKSDTGSYKVGYYTPGYTGKCAPSVSVEVINNIDSGGSGGGSSGPDDSSGGGSGGGIFDDIISGIANGVGSIIKSFFSIFKDLVDAIADAIVSITKSITDLMGLLKGDFTSFLSAVFPFMPQEFITIMVASLALCLLGVIIKIFRG